MDQVADDILATIKRFCCAPSMPPSGNRKSSKLQNQDTRLAAISERNSHAPSAGDIELIADREYRRIPAFMRDKVDPVMIRVVAFPARGAGEMELESPYELLGLYQGVSLDQSGSRHPRGRRHDLLYRRPLLDYGSRPATAWRTWSDMY